MQRKIVTIYAKAVKDICLNNKNLLGELMSFAELIQQNDYLYELLGSNVFTVLEIEKVVRSFVEQYHYSKEFLSIILYLNESHRLNLYQEMVVATERMCHTEKGLNVGVIEGRGDSLDNSIRTILERKIQAELDGEIELDYKKNTEITAGYKVRIADYQLDLTIDNQFKKLLKREGKRVD